MGDGGRGVVYFDPMSNAQIVQRKGPSGPPNTDSGGGIQPPAGQIDGTTTDPLVIGITTSDSIELDIGVIADGKFIKRIGTSLVGADAASDTDNITNNSNVPDGAGGNATGALNRLGIDMTKLNSTALTDADQTIATTDDRVMLAGTTTAARIKTVTPPATAFTSYYIYVGTQGHNVTILNGGAAGGSVVVTAGEKARIQVVSDGSQANFVKMPLEIEPLIIT